MTIGESIHTTIHLTNSSGVSLGLKNEFGNGVRGARAAQPILTKVTVAATIITNENDNGFYSGAPATHTINTNACIIEAGNGNVDYGNLDAT